MSRGIFRKSTSLLCLRRSFHFSTSKMSYGWQRKAYILDLASISQYIFASVDFRISFSRNKWLSFSEQRSTRGTHGLFFLFLYSLNNCRELHAVLNALCNSPDNLPFFLLSTTFFLWAVIYSQPVGLALISFLSHCSPCFSESLSLSVIFFLFFLHLFVCLFEDNV